MVDLSVEYCGETLKNPLICASGPPTQSPEACIRAAKAGFSGIVLKTLFHKALGPFRYQYTRPRFKVLDWRGLQDWRTMMSIPEKRVGEKVELMRPPHTLLALSGGDVGTYYLDEKYAEFVNKVKKIYKKYDAKVIASIGAGSQEGWEELCGYVDDSEADMVELNLGCPWVSEADKAFGGTAGAVPELAEKYTRICRKLLSIPIITKVNPLGIPNPTEVAKACERAGADGITSSDAGIKGLRIDIETGKPLGLTFASTAGPYILSYTLGRIAEMRMEGIKISISASFGIWDWDDVIRCIMVGADTVQPCRAIMLKGYAEATRWLNKITRWMVSKEYEDLRELKGISLKHVTTSDKVPRETPVAIGGKSSKIAVIDAEKCRNHLQNFVCGWCKESCFHFAIKVDEYAKVSERRCEACGLCESLCPVYAITLKPKS